MLIGCQMARQWAEYDIGVRLMSVLSPATSAEFGRRIQQQVAAHCVRIRTAHNAFSDEAENIFQPE
jgi:hypothetical protein